MGAIPNELKVARSSSNRRNVSNGQVLHMNDIESQSGASKCEVRADTIQCIACSRDKDTPNILLFAIRDQIYICDRCIENAYHVLSATHSRKEAA